jgi:hypothetical protein
MSVPGGVYLYCIGSTEDFTDEAVAKLSVATVDGSDAGFRVVTSEQLAAIVSDTSTREFDIERGPLMAHHHALEAAMSIGDILPVSYGTVADTDEAIVTGLLNPQRDQLLENLAYVRGRVELALRVMWDQDVLFQEIVDASEEIRALRDSIAGVPEDQSFSERIQLGELTSAALEYKREYERDQILQVLTPLAVDAEVKPSNSELLILNGSFLVEREREAEFDEAVQRIAGPREGRMTFRYLGPLPPANFVSVYIEAGDEE